MKNLKPLSKAEMKKVTGGSGGPCSSSADCSIEEICCGTTSVCIDPSDYCPGGGTTCYALCKDTSGNVLGNVSVYACYMAVSECTAVYSNTASATCSC